MNYSFIDIPFGTIHDDVAKLATERNAHMYGNVEYRDIGYSTEIFTSNLLDFLDQKNCKLGFAEIWKLPAHSTVFWHIDSNPPVDFAKLLIPWQSSCILFEWGQQLTTGNQKTGLRNYQYLGFEEDEVVVTDSIIINRPIIINPSVLHRAINQNNQDYYSINVSILDSRTRLRLTTHEAIDRLVSVS